MGVKYRQQSLLGLYLFRVAYFVEPPGARDMTPISAEPKVLQAARVTASRSRLTYRRFTSFIANVTSGAEEQEVKTDRGGLQSSRGLSSNRGRSVGKKKK